MDDITKKSAKTILQESVNDVLRSHNQRASENRGGIVSTILRPINSPKAAIQILSNADTPLSLDVFFDESEKGDVRLFQAFKLSSYYKKFKEEDGNYILNLNSNDDAAEIIANILSDVYNQPNDTRIEFIIESGGSRKNGCMGLLLLAVILTASILFL
jgi:hypothetical protein